MTIKKSVRLVDETIKLCHELSLTNDVNWSGSLNAMAQQYNLFVADCLPALSDAETMAFRCAFNGYLPHQDITQELRLLSWHISESYQYDSQVNDLFTDEEIGPFIDRVRAWSNAEKLAVIHMAKSFWRTGPVVDSE